MGKERIDIESMACACMGAAPDCNCGGCRCTCTCPFGLFFNIDDYPEIVIRGQVYRVVKVENGIVSFDREIE